MQDVYEGRDVKTTLLQTTCLEYIFGNLQLKHASYLDLSCRFTISRPECEGKNKSF